MSSTDSAFPETTVQQLVDELLVRGLDGSVMLSEIDDAVTRVSERAGLTVTLSSRRALGIEALRKVLHGRFMTAGDVVAGEGFVAWDLSASDALARIARGWEEPGDRLEMGNVCGLANTTCGNSYAGRSAAVVEFGDAFDTNVPGCWTSSPSLEALVAQTRQMRAHGHAYWRQFRAALEERGVAPGDSILILLHEDDVDQDYCLVASPIGSVYKFSANYHDLATSGLRVADWTDITDQVPASTVADVARARALASATAL